MKKFRTSPHAISGVFVFLLLGLFAVFSTVMVLLGARAYRGITARADAHNAARIAPAYVRSMLRADDETGVLRLETVDGVETLTLENVYDGDAFLTRIYCYEGSLREWFSEAELPFDPQDGEVVCAADAFSVSVDGSLLTARIRTGDTWTDVCVALRAEGEVSE